MAGDEGGVVLRALEAVQLGSPEGGLGQAGSRYMQPLLHLDPGGRTQVQFVKVGTELWPGSKGEDKRLKITGLPWLRSEYPPRHSPTQKDPISTQVMPYSSPPLKDPL